MGAMMSGYALQNCTEGPRSPITSTTEIIHEGEGERRRERERRGEIEKKRVRGR